MTNARTPNRLIGEPSLYLRQHAHNPVDWYPWGDEPLARARVEDRPILLSIGYSACHWCHVMARESFDDEVIASLMNELFVCIKVDREERPDIDAVYMEALRAMTGRGGWPLTAFLTPDLRPFYAGTYFPPSERGGVPSFPRVLRAVAAAYREQRQRVDETAARVIDHLARAATPEQTADPDSQELSDAGARLVDLVDAEHGGFGTAPKFPASSCIELLMLLDSMWAHAKARERARITLDRMSDGGVYDQLGGGFHRYSVDPYWRVPHFEKMLYDQAQLAEAYRHAWCLYGVPRYRDVCLGTLSYVCRELQSPAGGFYASQDAESEGEEGKYFLWSLEEIEEVVGAADAQLVARCLGATAEGNHAGLNVLQRQCEPATLARAFAMTGEEVAVVVERARRLLLTRRSERTPPQTDRKILADWNGMTIGALAAAGSTFRMSEFVDSAKRAADFVLERMRSGAGLYHFHAEGITRVEGFLSDYAFFGRGLVALYAATGENRYRKAAVQCADELLARFQDTRKGGFLASVAGGELPVWARKEVRDGAVPAGNTAAADFLYRLYGLCGDGRYEAAADAALRTAGADAVANPFAGASTLTTFAHRQTGYTLVVVVTPSPDSSPLGDAARSAFAPHATVLLRAPQPSGVPGGARWLSEIALPATMKEAAFVCRKGACGLPISNPAELRRVVTEASKP